MGWDTIFHCPMAACVTACTYHCVLACGACNPFMIALKTMARKYATPQQLDAMLGALEQDLPALVTTHSSPAAFWSEFMRRVEPIEDSSPDGDAGVLARLNAMLAPYGMCIAAVE